MPPPNGFADQSPPPPPGPGNNPAFQQFLAMITQNVQVAVQELLQQHLQQVAQSLRPDGRQIVVPRRFNPMTRMPYKEDGSPVSVQMSTPQLLAELNDNLIESNKLMKKSLKRAARDDDES
jgi:hypothetical protein